MSQLIVTSAGLSPSESSSEQHFRVTKRMTTVGTEPGHDLVVRSRSSGLLFTIAQSRAASGAIDEEIHPGRLRIRINGLAVNRATRLQSCDRIEWEGGQAVYLRSGANLSTASSASGASRSLEVLQNLATAIQGPGALEAGLNLALDALVEMAQAEVGFLLSETGAEAAGWELLSARRHSEAREGALPLGKRDLFSNTILQEALRLREPVHVENLIGHPWSEAASVIEARIFSAACFPLCVGERVFGAVFLMTRTPGRSIRRESFSELALLATQAGLLLRLEMQLKSARQENARLKTLLPERGVSILGQSAPILELTRKLGKIAPTELSLLILGETGTGKELVARELHRLSRRSSGPFVAVNCAAIPATLLESILFGHEKGAFTGAVRSHSGKFAQADGGTLFLDEIGDLPLELQAKLLRVLQEQQVEPLGSSKPVPINVRLLAATHQDVEKASAEGRFRQDLLFRLKGSVIKVPALRERGADLELLAEHFLGALGEGAPRFSERARQALRAHPWPGNVRELEQAIRRAAALAEGAEIEREDLELTPSPGSPAARPSGAWAHEDGYKTLQEAQALFTQDFVRRALDHHAGNRAQAARTLGVSERTLYRIISDPRDSAGREA